MTRHTTIVRRALVLFAKVICAKVLRAKIARHGAGVMAVMACLLGSGMLAGLSPNASAEPVRFAILHPDLNSASGSVFQQMLTGMERYSSADINANSFGESPDHAALAAWVNAQNPTTVILLGNQSLNLATQLAIKPPIVIGGVLKPPQNLAGISILGDPQQFFVQLKALAPRIKTVSIVYSPNMNDWWITPAIAIARKHGLTLKPLVATDVVTSARLYRDFLATAEPSHDALWIPLHDIAPMKTVLPLILRESWSRNIVVFSHNPLLAKQGVLFAMYPDNEAMGYQIAQFAAKSPRERGTSIVHAAKLHTALNRRTAAHLDLNVSEQMLQQFDRIYPVQ